MDQLFGYRLHQALLILALTAVVFGLGGCASQPALRPAEHAQGDGEGVRAESESVAIVAQSDAWAGTPDPIEGYQPVHVRIENRGEQPVRIRYRDFQLSIGDSARYPADPRAIEGSSHTSAYNRGNGPYDHQARQGFRVAPHHAGLFNLTHNLYSAGHRGLHGFGHGFHSGFGFRYGFGYGYPRFRYGGPGYGGPHTRRIHLPSRDMLLAALPEGVLEPGGHIEGFLYYPDLSQAARPEPDTAQPTTLTLTVVHAETNETLGRASLPFVYEH